MGKTAVEERAVISTQVSSGVREQLVRLARDADRTLSAEVRRAIKEHLTRERAQEAATR
jgi:predicted transcriptional regulator